MWTQSCFKSGFWNAFWNAKKGAFWMWSLILGPWTQSSFGTWFVRVRVGNACWSHAEAMHGSISADCAVGAKYYLAVRRSWSWLGRRLQCMWTHVVQITIPITFWIATRNVFRNVILAHVNTASIHKQASEITGQRNVFHHETEGKKFNKVMRERECLDVIMAIFLDLEKTDRVCHEPKSENRGLIR